ncbi:MAG: flagellar export chaperone FlgN [Thermotogae bacterium]|nr:flagellar export chaperone FlgN [Thermotogota bacterium]
MALNILREIIRKEAGILTDFFNLFEEMRDSVIRSDKPEIIDEIIYKIEKKSEEIEKLDSERNEVTEKLCEENSVNNSIKDFIEFLAKNDSDTAIELAGMIQKINDLAILIDTVREVIGFQENYNNFLFKIVNIDKTGKTTYSRKGYNSTFNDSNGWRG